MEQYASIVDRYVSTMSLGNQHMSSEAVSIECVWLVLVCEVLDMCTRRETEIEIKGVKKPIKQEIIKCSAIMTVVPLISNPLRALVLNDHAAQVYVITCYR